MTDQAPELLQTPQYIIEGIILRRMHEKRIEGYTFEMAKEIADALTRPPSPSDAAVAWRWRHVNDDKQEWRYQDQPIGDHNEYLEVQPLFATPPDAAVAPVGYFLFDGNDWHKVHQDFIHDKNVVSLYRATPPDGAVRALEDDSIKRELAFDQILTLARELGSVTEKLVEREKAYRSLARKSAKDARALAAISHPKDGK